LTHEALLTMTSTGVFVITTTSVHNYAHKLGPRCRADTRTARQGGQDGRQRPRFENARSTKSV
jgi:hypothetical protein